MRRYRAITLAIVMLLSQSGCAANRISNAMNSWVGVHYSKLVMAWGPPQQVFDDGQGGRMLLYTQTRQWTTPGQAVTNTTGQATIYDNMIWGQAQSVTEYRPPQTYGYTAWRMFQINSSGTIYDWSWRGL